jgi:hypothetical protein
MNVRVILLMLGDASSNAHAFWCFHNHQATSDYGIESISFAFRDHTFIRPISTIPRTFHHLGWVHSLRPNLGQHSER